MQNVLKMCKASSRTLCAICANEDSKEYSENCVKITKMRFDSLSTSNEAATDLFRKGAKRVPLMKFLG